MKYFNILFLLLIVVVLCVPIFGIIFAGGNVIYHLINQQLAPLGGRVIFGDYVRGRAIINILERSVTNSVFVVAMSLPFVYILIRGMTKNIKLLVLSLMSLPYLINEAIRIFSLKIMLSYFFGYITYIIPFYDSTYSSIISNSEIGVLFGMYIGTFSFSVFVTIISMLFISEDIWRSSQDLGATVVFEYINIYLPLARYGALLSFFIIIIMGLSMSTEVAFMGGASRQSMRIIINDLLSASKIDVVMLFGFVIVVMVILVVVVFYYYIINRREYVELL
jgi:ABC-type spermidine/putrescine transport system permease subunit I